VLTSPSESCLHCMKSQGARCICRHAVKLLLLRNADATLPNAAGQVAFDLAPPGSPVQTLLAEEAAWRHYLEQARPCTVVDGVASSSLLGIVSASGAATVWFEPLAGVMHLESVVPQPGRGKRTQRGKCALPSLSPHLASTSRSLHCFIATSWLKCSSEELLLHCVGPPSPSVPLSPLSLYIYTHLSPCLSVPLSLPLGFSPPSLFPRLSLHRSQSFHGCLSPSHIFTLALDRVTHSAHSRTIL
jgi:hypothetical protein